MGLRAELSALRIRALKAHAREAGVSEALLAEAEDADDMKQAVVDLVLAASGGGGGGGGGGEELQLLRRELAALRLKQLRQRARELGVSDEDLDSADDADEVRTAWRQLRREPRKMATYGLQLDTIRWLRLCTIDSTTPLAWLSGSPSAWTRLSVFCSLLLLGRVV